MPRHHIVRAVVLLDRRVLSIRLVKDHVWDVQVVVNVRDGEQKVAGVGKSMTTNRSQVWQFPDGSPNLGDVSTSLGVSLCQVDAEPDTSLQDAYLTNLQVDAAKLGLNVERAELWADKEVAVGIAESAAFHALVDHVDVETDSLAEIWVATASECVQSVDEVYGLVGAGDGEWAPFCLVWDCLHGWIIAQKAVFEMSFSLDLYVAT